MTFEEQVQLERLKHMHAAELQVAETKDRGILEQQKHQAAIELQRIKNDDAEGQALLRAGIDFAIAALRSLLIINGGAAIALLAFAGHQIASRSPSGAVTLVAISGALQGFAVGVAAAVVSGMMAYLSQMLIAEHRHERWACWTFEIARVLGVAAAAFSLAAFLYGTSEAGKALESASSRPASIGTRNSDGTPLWGIPGQQYP